MAPPYSSFHAQTRASKASRPRARRSGPPSAANSFSTTIWVAMPAWSVPGSHSVGRPRMRATRAMMSCKVTNMAWPMCSLPVTLGGGIAITKGGAVMVGSASVDGLKWPPASQAA